jgi:hypothetical protein
MPLQATSGAASYDAFGGGVAVVPNYIEDVFSTWLTTGASANITVVNGIDLAGKGGMVWQKTRNSAGYNTLFDTVRGANYYLSSNTTSAQAFSSNILPTFNSDGFVIGTDNNLTTSGTTGVNWTLRKQPKFFDVVTWNGDGSGSRSIAHALGSVPACVIMRSVNTADNWAVFHRGMVSPNATWWQNYMLLDDTQAAGNYGTAGLSSEPTSANLNVASGFNSSGKTFIAYLFAHNAGGFGLTGTDNVISCGSFTTDANGYAAVNLGYEPQWVLTKTSSDAQSWYIQDNMRGMPVRPSTTPYLTANSADAEVDGSAALTYPTSTGFVFDQNISVFNSKTFIYIAIRRGPMRVPTDGTKVYQANTYTGNATANTTVAGNFGFPVDLLALSSRSANSNSWGSYGQLMLDRLRGQDRSLGTALTTPEVTGWSTYNSLAVQNSIGWGLYGADSGTDYLNNSGGTWIARGFQRAPGFFDEVCFKSANGTQNHNLGVAPELVIMKTRGAADSWYVFAAQNGFGEINRNVAWAGLGNGSGLGVNLANVTSTTLSAFSVFEGVGVTCVAYLFASAPGVSKVGSYTGTGTTQTINCGFTGGARFVLIKRTDSTGDWYVWDSARGIVAGNDPYLLLNSTAAEVTSTDYVDTAASGFEISSTAPAAINASGGTYIFLAIA